MKKILASSVVVLMVLFLSAGLGLAANGKGGGKGGGGSTGGGIGPIHVISDGVPFTYEGTVVSLSPGLGMVIATVVDEEGTNVTIYGIGPVRYWDSEDVDVPRPGIGELITVTGHTVDYNGVSLNIATEITVGDDIVPLRDLETGAALWRGSGGKSN